MKYKLYKSIFRLLNLNFYLNDEREFRNLFCQNKSPFLFFIIRVEVTSIFGASQNVSPRFISTFQTHTFFNFTEKVLFSLFFLFFTSSNATSTMGDIFRIFFFHFPNRFANINGSVMSWFFLICFYISFD